MAISSVFLSTFINNIAYGYYSQTDTHKVALLNDPTSPYGGVQFYSQIKLAEVSDPSYTAQELPDLNSGMTPGADGVSTLLVTAGPVTWTALTATFRYAVVYTLSSALSPDLTNGPLVYAIDMGETQTLTATDFTLDFTNAVLTIKGT